MSSKGDSDGELNKLPSESVNDRVSRLDMENTVVAKPHIEEIKSTKPEVVTEVSSDPRKKKERHFISSKILPINMLYFETMSTFMYDISNNSAPQNISTLFRKSNLIHPYKTRSSSSGNFYIQYSRLNQQHNSSTRFGARVWNCLPPQVRQLPKKQFKKKVREILFAIFHAEDTYVEAPTLLLKMIKYVK